MLSYQLLKGEEVANDQTNGQNVTWLYVMFWPIWPKKSISNPLLCSLAIFIIFLLSDVHGAFETQLALVFAIRVSKLACWPPPPSHHHPSPLLSCDSAQLILDSTIPIVLWRRNANCCDESDEAANPNQWKWLNCGFDTLELKLLKKFSSRHYQFSDPRATR